MRTILKGFSVIMVLRLLSLLLIKIFQVEVFIGVLVALVFLVICYAVGLLVEDMWD